MENLLTEISVMKDIDHRHIVKLINFEVINSYLRRYYIISQGAP